MKALFLTLLLTTYAHAVEPLLTVPAYNKNYCGGIKDVELFGAQEYTITIDGEAPFHFNASFLSIELAKKIETWHRGFISAGDTLLKEQYICVGIENDLGAPNASAYGYYYLTMGAFLYKELERNPTIDKEIAKQTVMAHEYSHYLQNRYELVFDYTLKMLSTKIKENHADCMAGYILTLHHQITGNNKQHALKQIESIGSQHAVSTHGMPKERVEAFGRGVTKALDQYRRGKNVSNTRAQDVIDACSAFYIPTN